MTKEVRTKQAYIIDSISKFAELLNRRFGKEWTYYRSVHERSGYSNIIESIASVEHVSEEEVLNLLESAFRQVGNPESYNIFFNKEDVPQGLLDSVVEVQFPIYDDRPIVISKRFSKNTGKTSVELGSRSSSLFREILEESLNLNASDIHFIPKMNSFNVFFRVDGLLIRMNKFTMNLEVGQSLVDFLLYEASKYTKGSFNPDMKYKAQDARIDTSIGDSNLILRLSFVPSGWDEKLLDVTIRIIKKERGFDLSNKTLKERLFDLGILEEDIWILESIKNLKSGLVVVSGKTNSGKSFLINTILSYIRGKKIGTIEDPIEYYIHNLECVQHQLFTPRNETIKMDFDDYVKAFKRGDYDIVFIGEWRRSNSLTESILEQSYAGQLVVTTLHISDSFEIYNSLKNMYKVEPEKIKDILYLSYNQTLIPKLCDKCKIEVKNFVYSEEMLNIAKIRFQGDLEKFSKPLGRVFVRNEDGCTECIKGYKGRTPVYDYFINNKDLSLEEIWNISISNKIIKKKKTDVFFTKVNKGIIDPNDFILL